MPEKGKGMPRPAAGAADTTIVLMPRYIEPQDDDAHALTILIS